MSKIKQTVRARKWIIALLCICLASLATVCFMTIASKADDSETKGITHGFATNNVVPSEKGDKGTATNPAVILEIVPDMKFSQVGYMINGCEPIDMKKLLNDIRKGKDNAPGYLSDICSSGAASYQNLPEVIKKFELDPETDNPDKFQYRADDTMTQKGYYERVENGKGTHVQEVKEQDEEGTVLDATYRKVENGEKGDFVWVPYDKEDVPETDHNAPEVGDRVYTSRTDHYYINYYYQDVVYTNKNIFLKEVFMLDDDEIKDYHVVVKTVTPSELNAHNEWADRADLVFFTNKTYRSTLCDAYRAYSKIPYSNTNANDNMISFSNSNDLTWETVMKLFHKIAIDKDQAGVIIDQAVFSAMLHTNDLKDVTVGQMDLNGNLIANSNSTCKGSNNNVFKLCLMLNTMNPQVFYNTYLYDYEDGRKAVVKEGTVDGRTTGVYGIQKGDAQTYWGVNTFLPPKPDGSVAGYNDWYNGDCYTSYETKTQLEYGNGAVNSHVYLFPSDMSILDCLNHNMINKDDLNKELFAFIKQQTGTNLTSTTPAKAIQFIMGLIKNPKKLKDSIRVLDLEPCSISKKITCNKNYLTEELIKTRLAPTYTGDVTIDHQSTAEFNGKLDDLNSTYDLIYMGLYYGRFNTSAGKTVYNDTTLNGKIYLHVGDRIVARNENQHSVSWLNNLDATRGPGNDITSRKLSELENYLQSGLPIIVDSDLYKNDTGVIDQTSYVYDFIRDNKKKENVLDVNGDSIVSAVTNSLKKSGLVIHMDEGDYPKEYEGETTTGTIDSDAYISRNLRYQFSIEDSEGEGATYTARLYIDASRDGTYSSDEVIAHKEGLVAGDTKYTISKKLGSNYVGAIPWKLIVTKDSNSAVRDTKIGFSAIRRAATQKKTISVLQITDPTGSTLNLEKNVAEEGLFYKYTKNLNDYIVNFTTIDTKTFESWYTSTKRFDGSASEDEKAAADQLGSFNMLIFGFADGFSNISNQYGALDNVKYYIDSGKSVLFTHDLTSFFNVANEYTANQATNKGYNFNVMFRDYFGMDRYGARTKNQKLLEKKDKATKPDGGYYDEIHGYTYQAVTKLGDSAKNLYPLYTGSPLTANTIATTSATKMNGGQITEYPYKIDDNLKVAPTHSQYYQLELNDDDMIVWYTLSQDDGNDNGYFSSSANDAANNYYIYSKGNVMYSGVGHSDFSNNEMEVKLFINTMIASYANSSEKPTIEVVNPGVYMDNDNEYSLYVSVDYAETNFKENRYEDVSFIPRNNSLITNTLNVKAVTDDGIQLQIYNDAGKLVSGSDLGYVELRDGETYHLQWPQSYLSEPERQNINFSCYYTDKRDNVRQGEAITHLLRRNMFDLE